LRGLTSKSVPVHTKYAAKWNKIGVIVGICLGNSHDNFQLHKFTISENTAKSFRWATFLTHTV